jgi:DNA-binding Lrp family transcriptional regulator
MLDQIDQRILRELQAAGRSSATELARLVEISVSTVHRRTAALFEQRRVRVGVLPVAASEEAYRLYELRVRCRPGRQRDVALALTARSDMRWVAVVTGDYGVAAELVVPAGIDVAGVLFDDIERDENIVGTQSSLVLRTFKAPAVVAEAFPFDPALPGADSEGFDPADRAILTALQHDGRLSYAAVAATTGISETTVRRRIQALLGSQRAKVVTVVHPQSLGYDDEAIIRLDVLPDQVEAVAAQLAAHPGVRHLAATFGETALVAEVLMRTPAETYGFLAETVGRAAGITRMTVEVELLVTKRAYLPTPWAEPAATAAAARLHAAERAPRGGSPNHLVSASRSPRPVLSPAQATYPSGRTRTAAGGDTAPTTGSSQGPP